MLKHLVAAFACLSLFATSLVVPARAAMLDTAQLVAAQQGDDARDRVASWLARDDVRGQFEAWGVDAAQAQSRVAALTDAEVAELAATIDQQPAGAGALEVLGIVLIVLIVLELVGVIDVFSQL